MNNSTPISTTNFSQNEVDSYTGGDGGGFYGVASSALTLTMGDCNFTQNISTFHGGGIYLSSSSM